MERGHPARKWREATQSPHIMLHAKERCSLCGQDVRAPQHFSIITINFNPQSGTNSER